MVQNANHLHIRKAGAGDCEFGNNWTTWTHTDIYIHTYTSQATARLNATVYYKSYVSVQKTRRNALLHWVIKAKTGSNADIHHSKEK